MDRADVPVIQGGRRFGFTPKTAEGLRVVGKFVGKELHSDVATELEVFSLIHHAHAPTPDLVEDAVMGNGLPHGLGRSGHWVEMLGGALSKGQSKGERTAMRSTICLGLVTHLD